jgi:two-component system CheB/CheR fusion protein
MFAGKTADDQIRVWVPACATGEEAYSIGMLLSEYASRFEDVPKIQIFASDVDEDAIAFAREGLYGETSCVQDVSPARLRSFFTREGNSFRVKKSLREMILFAPHNVLRDPPFSKLDFVSCRNLLIYLNREAQERVMSVFHFSLLPDGFLFVGSSESAESLPLLFSPYDKNSEFTCAARQIRLTTRRWRFRITTDGFRKNRLRPKLRTERTGAPFRLTSFIFECSKNTRRRAWSSTKITRSFI